MEIYGSIIAHSIPLLSFLMNSIDELFIMLNLFIFCVCASERNGARNRFQISM